MYKELWWDSTKDNECFESLKPLHGGQQAEMDIEEYSHVGGSSRQSECEQMF